MKRVIGRPGETVTFRDGQVQIDDRPLNEPYLEDGVTTTPSGETVPPGCGAPAGGEPGCVVPPGTVFMMGDNREASKDSRVFGPIKQDTIVGRVFVRIWPLSDHRFPLAARFVRRATPQPWRPGGRRGRSRAASMPASSIARICRTSWVSQANARTSKRWNSSTSPRVHSVWCRFIASIRCSARSAACRSSESRIRCAARRVHEPDLVGDRPQRPQGAAGGAAEPEPLADRPRHERPRARARRRGRPSGRSRARSRSRASGRARRGAGRRGRPDARWRSWRRGAGGAPPRPGARRPRVVDQHHLAVAGRPGVGLEAVAHRPPGRAGRPPRCSRDDGRERPDGRT